MKKSSSLKTYTVSFEWIGAGGLAMVSNGRVQAESEDAARKIVLNLNPHYRITHVAPLPR